MFDGAETFNQLKLFLPALDLGKCKSMNYAFRNSPVSELNLRNCENVGSAVQAICGCWRLEKCPSIYFESKDPGALGIERAKEVNPQKAFVEKVFEGCD